jgi:hypothetical protein
MKTLNLAVGCIVVLVVACLQLSGQANTSLSNLVAPTKVNVNLVPGTTGTRSLGSDTRRWKDIHMSGTLYREGYTWLAGEYYSFNTFVGLDAGYTNQPSQSTSQDNTFVGANSGFYNTTGTANTFLGSEAGYANTTGGSNTFVGWAAGDDNILGEGNVFLGVYAGNRNTNGRYNICIGHAAGAFSKTGNSNVYIGNEAGDNNSTGSYNTIIGDSAGQNITSSYNTMMGRRCGLYTSSGALNAFFGYQAGLNNNTGAGNTAVGGYALQNNNAIGDAALGYSAGSGYTNGNYSTFVGYNADANVGSLTNSTALGYNSLITASNQVRIGNSSVTSIGGYTGWSNISDGRFKKNIKENVPGLTFINQLRPVTYTLDIAGIDNFLDKKATKENEPVAQDASTLAAREAKQKVINTGFVAQEVEKAAKKIGYDFSGVDAPASPDGLYGLRYAEFVVPLVKAVQELSSMNDDKTKAIADLKTQLADQQKQINELKAMIAGQNAASSVMAAGASLEQNMPNPFNGKTTIGYTLPGKFAAAQIAITDKSGSVVKQLNISGAGKGTVQVDASSLVSGSYHYCLYVDGKLIDSRPMVLEK